MFAQKNYIMFGWLWLVIGADLLWEKSTAGWLVASADLMWEKNTIDWLANKPTKHSIMGPHSYAQHDNN